MEETAKSSPNLFPEEAASLIREHGQLLEAKKGEILFTETDRCPQLYLVEEGYIALYRSSRYGERKVIFICSAGEVLNEIVLEDEKTSIAAVCLTDVRLSVVEDGWLKERVGSQSAEGMILARALYESLAMKTRRLYHQTGNANRTYPVEKRLAAKLWRLAKEHGILSGNGVQIPFELTVTMLANVLGAKRETVSRAVSDLKKAGCICHEDGFMTVMDMELLRTKM